jgi:hypothetical protein
MTALGGSDTSDNSSPNVSEYNSREVIREFELMKTDDVPDVPKE